MEFATNFNTLLQSLLPRLGILQGAEIYLGMKSYMAALSLTVLSKKENITKEFFQ